MDSRAIVPSTTGKHDEPALPTAALQEEHQQLRQALNAFPDGPARALERLAADAGRRREELTDLDSRIRQTAHQLDRLGFLSRHGREGDELRRETRRLESDRTCLQERYANRSSVGRRTRASLLQSGTSTRTGPAGRTRAPALSWTSGEI